MIIFGIMELTSLTPGSLFDILYLDLSGLTIACDDTYLTDSTTDQFDNPLPPGVNQPVSQWIYTCVNSTVNNLQTSMLHHRYGFLQPGEDAVILHPMVPTSQQYLTWKLNGLQFVLEHFVTWPHLPRLTRTRIYQRLDPS